MSFSICLSWHMIVLESTHICDPASDYPDNTGTTSVMLLIQLVKQKAVVVTCGF